MHLKPFVLFVPNERIQYSKIVFCFFPTIESPTKSFYDATLNLGEDDEMEIAGYRRSNARTALTWMCFVLTLGMLRLIMHWWKHWLLLATHVKCTLEEAEKLLITEQFEGKHTVYYVKDVITLNNDSLL